MAMPMGSVVMSIESIHRARCEIRSSRACPPFGRAPQFFTDLREPLKNPSLDFSETNDEKCGFRFSSFPDHFRDWEMAVHHCTVRNL